MLVALKGRGKSRSGRIIYVYVSRKEKVYFLLHYPKNQLADLSTSQKAELRRLVQQLEEE